MTDIQFIEDLPPDSRATENIKIADALRARPGEWAHIGTKAPSHATNIKSGVLKPFQPKGSFEAVTRNLTNGKADIYARYVGG